MPLVSLQVLATGGGGYGDGHGVKRDPSNTMGAAGEALSVITSYRLTALIYFLAAVGVVPFVFYHAALGHHLLFALILGTVGALVGGALFTVTRGNPGHTGKLIAAVTAAAILATFAEVGSDALHWAFPFTLINYYIFPLRWALLINGLFLGAFFPLATAILPAAALFRVVASLLITNLIAVVFSHTVQRKQRDLSRLATRDPLTGLGNRRSLDRALADSVARHERSGTPAVAVVLDLDHFKAVNDNLGHHRGDEVLAESAGCLARRLRRTDGLYRFGGEEFVAVLTDTDEEEGAGVAEALRRLIAARAFTAGIHLTASLGVAELTDGDTPSSWLARADNAVYRAKTGGRDRVEVAPAGGAPGPQTGPGMATAPEA
jgi:diguanylate cyclase (GGDEF)-like protein